jgi:hypothetical protein
VEFSAEEHALKFRRKSTSYIEAIQFTGEKDRPFNEETSWIDELIDDGTVHVVTDDSSRPGFYFDISGANDDSGNAIMWIDQGDWIMRSPDDDSYYLYEVASDEKFRNTFEPVGALEGHAHGSVIEAFNKLNLNSAKK